MPRLQQVGEYEDGTPVFVSVPTLAEYMSAREVDEDE